MYDVQPTNREVKVDIVLHRENPDRWVGVTLSVTYIGKTEEEVNKLLSWHKFNRRRLLPGDTIELTGSDADRFGSWSNGIWLPAKEYEEYFKHIRYPSRRWPYSYFKAAMTLKFVKWLKVHRPYIFDLEN